MSGVDSLEQMFALQLELQIRSMKDGDPRALEGDARAQFMTWNAWAACDELHEALAETGWKPWASSRHVNGEAVIKECVDAMHFLMNMCIVAGAAMEPAVTDPRELARLFFGKYAAKNAVNAERQRIGYDGVSTKCPNCKRELSETDETKNRLADTGARCCSADCARAINFDRILHPPAS